MTTRSKMRLFSTVWGSCDEDPHTRSVSYGAIRDRSDAAKTQVYVGMNLAPKCAAALRMHAEMAVHVLQHHDPRSRNREHVVPPVSPIEKFGYSVCNGKDIGTNAAGGGVPNDRRMRWKHGFVHFVDFGGTIQVAELNIASGDLLMADQHGALLIPEEIAADIPAVAFEIEKKKRRIIHFCCSSAFSLEELRKLVKEDESGLPTAED
jgi:hypothetical protein